MASKLDEQQALACAGQIIGAIEKIEANHGWSAGDTAAVIIATATEILARRLGPTRTIELFRGQAEVLHAEHLRRSQH